MLMTDDTFNVSWDAKDKMQIEEDEWVSSVIGTEEDAIYDVLAENSNEQRSMACIMEGQKRVNGLNNTISCCIWNRKC